MQQALAQCHREFDKLEHDLATLEAQKASMENRVCELRKKGAILVQERTELQQELASFCVAQAVRSQAGHLLCAFVACV